MGNLSKAAGMELYRKYVKSNVFAKTFYNQSNNLNYLGTGGAYGIGMFFR